MARHAVTGRLFYEGGQCRFCGPKSSNICVAFWDAKPECGELYANCGQAKTQKSRLGSPGALEEAKPLRLVPERGTQMRSSGVSQARWSGANLGVNLGCVGRGKQVNDAGLAGAIQRTSMEITYTMIGTDGQQYGPVTLEQFQGWIAEGRIVPETKVMRSDTKSWLVAAQYVELGLSAPVAPPIPAAGPQPLTPARPQTVPSQGNLLLVRRSQSGARWFFWIAGLSVVNFFAAAGNMMFVVGLAVGLLFPGVGTFLGAGIFVLLGFFAWKGHTWSFIVGMVLYAGDGLLFALYDDWLSVAFHAYILFRLFLGLKANLELKAIPGATAV